MTDFATDYVRGRHDPVFWAKRFLGVRLHPGQQRFADVVAARGKNGWRAAYHTICLSAGNRAGKTMVLAVLILWSCFYHVGQPPPESFDEAGIRKWRRKAYFWFHFAIQQEIAELVYTEIINLLSGVHTAQANGCPLADEIAEAGGGPIADWSKKYNGDYRWVVFGNLFGGAEIHFRTTAENAIGSLGRDMHGVSVDECGLAKNLKWVFNNVLHLRRLGTGGQAVLVSTPDEGLTDFSDMWFAGDPDAPDRRRGNMSLRMSTRDNVGFGISKENFAILTEGMEADHIRQNIDGYFIQGRLSYFNGGTADRMFRDDLPESQPAIDGHTYVQGIDPALRHDSTWSVVGDVWMGVQRDGKWEPSRGLKLGRNEIPQLCVVGVRADQQHGKQTVDSLTNLAVAAHNEYENKRDGLKTTCATAIDATGFGGKIFKELLERVIGAVRSIEFGGSAQTKKRLLGDLRSMVDSGRLMLPREGLWLKGRRQMLGYREGDRAIEQDFVMALAVLVAEVKRQSPDGYQSLEFDFLNTGQQGPKPRESVRERLNWD